MRTLFGQFANRCRFTKLDRVFFWVRLIVLAGGLLWVVSQKLDWRILPHVDNLGIIFLAALVAVIAHTATFWAARPSLTDENGDESRFRRNVKRVEFAVTTALVAALCYHSGEPLSSCSVLFFWVISVAAARGRTLWGVWAAILCMAVMAGLTYGYWGTRSFRLEDAVLAGIAALGLAILVGVLRSAKEVLLEQEARIQVVAYRAARELGRLIRPPEDGKAAFVFDRALRIALRRTMQLADTRKGYICIIDEANRRPVVRFPRNLGKGGDGKPVYPERCLDRELPNAGLVTQAFRTGKSCVVNDHLADQLNYLPVWKDSNSELVVPIISEGNVVAVINIEHTQEDAFPPVLVDAVKDFANTVASVLTFAMQWDALKILHELAPKVSPAAGVRGCLGQICAALEDSGKYLAVCMWLYDESRNELVLKESFGLEGPLGRLPTIPLDRPTMAGRTFDTEQLLFVQDVQDYEHPPKEMNGHWSAVFYPLAEREKLGVVGFYADERDFLPSEEAKFLEMVVGITARAVASAKRHEELEAYQRITKALADAKSLDDLLTAATTETCEILGAEACGVLLVDSEDESRLVPKKGVGLGDDWLDVFGYMAKGATGLVASEKKSLRAFDIREADVCDESQLAEIEKCLESGRVKAWLGVPILSSDEKQELLGVIKLFNKSGDPGWFTSFDQEILELIGREVALALESAERVEALRRGDWWRGILNTIGEEVLVVDPDLNIVFVNETKKRKFPEIEEGKKCWEYWPTRGGYRLTEERRDAIGRAGVPSQVLAKLEPLVDCSFATMQRFEGRLRDLLSPAEADAYAGTVVAYVPEEPPQDGPCEGCPSVVTFRTGEPQHTVQWSWHHGACMLTTSLLPPMPGHPKKHVVEVCRTMDEQAAVRDTALTVQRAQSEEDILTILLDTIASLGRRAPWSRPVTLRVRLYLANETGTALISKRCLGMPAETTEWFKDGGLVQEHEDGSAAWAAIESGEPLVVVYIPDGESCEKLEINEQGRDKYGRKALVIGDYECADRLGIRPCQERLDLPLVAGEHIIGKLSVDYGKEDRRFSTFLFDVLGMLSAHAAQAILNVRRMEESRRLATIGQYADAVLHRDKGKLGGVRLYTSSLARSDGLSAGDRRRVDKIDGIVGFVQRDLRGLLLGLRPPRPEPRTASEGQLQDLLNTFQTRSAEHGIDMEMRWHVPSGLSVQLDSEQMDEVLECLFSNSVAALAEAGATPPRIVLTADVADGRLRIVWEDNGVGISEEDFPRIWEPYFSQKREGTGLGLAIARCIVENHGGAIEAEPERRCGATFTIKLPCERAEVWTDGDVQLPLRKGGNR